MSNYLERKYSKLQYIFRIPGLSAFCSDIAFRCMNSYSTHGSHQTHRKLNTRYGKEYSDFAEHVRYCQYWNKKRCQNPVKYKEHSIAQSKELQTWMEEGMICCGNTDEDNAPYEFKLKP